MKFMVLPLLALFGALPQYYSYEMATCPTGASCTSAQTCTAGSCSGTTPTTNATQGMPLGGVSGFRLTVCAASGQTLSGAGSMQAYAYNSAEGRWARNPGLDQNVTSTNRCQVFPDFTTGLRFDRARFIASSVTVSGGAGLDVLLEGQGASVSR